MSHKRKQLIRIVGLICLFLGVIGFYFSDKQLAILSIVSGTGLLILSSVSIKKNEVVTVNDFINLFTHFRVSLDSEANVFQALTSCLNVAGGKIYEELEKLITVQREDHSVMPFINFAKFFNNHLVTHIMINIYMLINNGLEPKRLWQFNYIFENLIKENNDHQLLMHENSYERFNTTLFLGTGVLLFTLMSSILTMIGNI